MNILPDIVAEICAGNIEAYNIQIAGKEGHTYNIDVMTNGILRIETPIEIFKCPLAASDCLDKAKAFINKINNADMAVDWCRLDYEKMSWSVNKDVARNYFRESIKTLNKKFKIVDKERFDELMTALKEALMSHEIMREWRGDNNDFELHDDTGADELVEAYADPESIKYQLEEYSLLDEFKAYHKVK